MKFGKSKISLPENYNFKISWLPSYLYVLALWIPISSFAQESWPILPSPGRATQYWIAKNVEQNGITMQIRGFDSTLSLTQVQEFYRGWLADKQGVTKQERADGMLLGARMGAYQITVQFQPTKSPQGVTGTLTAARVYEGITNKSWRAEAVENFPLAPGTTLISNTLSVDEGKTNRTMIAVNNISIETNLLYLREHLIVRGWQVVDDRTIVAGKSGLLVMRHLQGGASREAVITLVRQEKGVLIVASITDTP